MYDYDMSRTFQDDGPRSPQNHKRKRQQDVPNPGLTYSALGDYLHAHTEGLTVSAFIYDAKIR